MSEMTAFMGVNIKTLCLVRTFKLTVICLYMMLKVKGLEAVSIEQRMNKETTHSSSAVWSLTCENLIAVPFCGTSITSSIVYTT